MNKNSPLKLKPSSIISSFDVFDTLVTRTVIHPHTIHLLVGRKLISEGYVIASPLEYKNARVKAEEGARRGYSHREVLLSDIILQLSATTSNLPAADILTAIELETEKEHLVRNEEGLKLLDTARNNSASTIFISDMYLSAEQIRYITSDLGIFYESDKIFVSGECKASKASGSLYAQIEKHEASDTTFIHCGDNYVSDIVNAKKAGWEAVHVRTAIPNRYESIPVTAKELTKISKLLGSVRHTRANLAPDQLDDHSKTVYEIGLNVAGPLLTAYALKVAEWCKKDSITKLLCFSRDGQILKEILDRLSGQGLPLPTAHYIYISRNAIQLALAGKNCNLPILDIDPRRNFSLRSAFETLGLNVDEYISWLKANGWETNDLNEVLTDAQLSQLSAQVKCKEFSEKHKIELKKQYHHAFEYLKSNGVFESNTAYCDVGWRGTIVNCLNEFGDTNTGSNKHTYFIGRKDLEEKYILQNVRTLFNGTKKIHEINCCSEIIELFTAADHGGALYYRGHTRGPVVLTGEVNKEALNWGLESLRRGIYDFLEAYSLTYQKGDSTDSEDISALAQQNLLRLIEKPSRKEAFCISRFPVSVDSTHRNGASINPVVTPNEVLALILKRKRHTKFWLPGLRHTSGHVCCLIIQLNLVRRFIIRCFRCVIKRGAHQR